MGRQRILLDDHTADPAIRHRRLGKPSSAREFHLDPRAREHITANLAAGRKRTAIKAYRRLTGAGFLAARRAMGLWPTT